ncbi:MAG: dTDP-4-dehydrorhamnose 3,5-epimerase [Patescibacteria group bacterium]
MKFITTKFDTAWLIQPEVFKDERGFFLESYSKDVFFNKGITSEFVQDNHSRSEQIGVLRGIHFQLPPFEQAKLVRVTRGAVFDVIVDLRKTSPTYGQWQAFELTAENFKMIYAPRGFAHGFCTLKPHTEFQYKVDNVYAPDHDSGIMWDDPTLSIDWPIHKPILSVKDSQLGPFSDISSPF